MRGVMLVAGAALLAGGLAGCKQDAGEATADALVVRTAMKQQVNPATLAIWDIGNNAMGDDGGIDPAKMDDARWAALADHAGKLGEAARMMAGAKALTAAELNTSSMLGPDAL